MASCAQGTSVEDNESDYNSDDDIPRGGTDDEMYGTDSDSDDDIDYATHPPIWSTATNGMRPITFEKEEGFLIPTPGEGKPIDYFNILLDNICLENIVKFTNKNAFEVFFSRSITPQSRINKWKPLTVSELKTFIGLLLHTGTIKLNRLQDYWKTHWLFNLNCFSQYMSRDRFLLILRCLYFTDNRVQQPKEN